MLNMGFVTQVMNSVSETVLARYETGGQGIGV